MKKILLILPLVTLAVAGCQLGATNSSYNYSPNPTSTTGDLSATTTMTTQKFSDSADYQSAYLISGASLDSSAQQALTGFNLSKQTLPNGSIQINLKAVESGYQDQQYTLQSGQQLYFVDRTFGDDRNSEGNQGDDYGIIVDAQGFVVSGGQ